jgi:E3 ubiquitin-protein ligase listerin
LHRLQNEVASKLSGVGIATVSTEGIKLLRLLNALAPSPDSTSDFIPQQRVVFLLKNISGWLLDDESDLPEELEVRIVELYEHLCPVVQDVPGAHWHSIFDLIASNLEVRMRATK